ncbi:dickkopf-related protein 3a isoform X1 [Oncorhynchus keta]|uniref:dickkopf-related protein 3a isoform X1 n=2 Tax=Oncorhynchus keta TaxID=8018 RepID=UPI0015F949A3|nr:dickkopf-related protein 3a isoform X1 [Oncorhynchus keta]
MLYFSLLTLSLTSIHGILLPESARPVDLDINQILEDNMAQGHTTLNNMFEEVEQLMEDTHNKLDDSVHQMDNESAKSSLHPNNLPSNYHNDSTSESVVENQSIHTIETVHKETDNRTEETHITRTVIQSSGKENNIHHECIIDEDCEKGKYCRYETHRSKCLTCKALDVPCKKNEECCSGQLCVWGQCSQNATKGEAGSICQYQNDCSPDLCCAFHKALQFPVCTAKPIERERCHGSPNHLMELLSWDIEGQGSREHCPCAGDLQCQHLGRGSLCLKRQNSSEEDLTDTLYSEIDYIV